MGVLAEACIDIPAALLQSDAIPAQSPVAPVVLTLTAALATALVVWKRLDRCPATPLGRAPIEPLVGVAAFVLSAIAGSIAASLAGELERVTTLDAEYLRLARGAAGNIAQVVLAFAVMRSAWFIQGAEKVVSVRRSLAMGVIAFLLVAPIVSAAAFAVSTIQSSLGAPPAPEIAHETLAILRQKGDSLFTILTLAHVVLLVPLAEEACWRGLLHPSLRRLKLGASGACVATALLFTLIHWSVLAPDARAIGIVMLFILGVALSIVRERSGGVLAPTVLHAAFNGANVALALGAH